MNASAPLEQLQLSFDEARRLTDEVKRDAKALWRKLVHLYEGGAHQALGYSSWHTYCEAEFGFGQSHAYRLLDAGRVAEIVPQLGNEAQARELVPLLDTPDELIEVIRELRAEYGEQLTAEKVRQAVRERLGKDQVLAYMGSSASDDWPTPQDLFDRLDAEFGFTTDVCALPYSAKCSHYYTPEQDGLAQEWRGKCWMNPPYGKTIGQWIRKAWEAAQAGATVVCLVPARVDTEWWQDYCARAEIRFLRGRLTFQGSDSPAPFPSAVVVFGREPNTRNAHWDWR